MTEREPKLFKNWSAYTRQRQAMASAVIFESYRWSQWQEGHAKLYGILLWQYEIKKQTRFKYSKTLKKQGYRRTHNYRLLKKIVDNKLLRKEGNGYYSFTLSQIEVIEKVLPLIKKLGMIKKAEG